MEVDQSKSVRRLVLEELELTRTDMMAHSPYAAGAMWVMVLALYPSSYRRIEPVPAVGDGRGWADVCRDPKEGGEEKRSSGSDEGYKTMMLPAKVGAITCIRVDETRIKIWRPDGSIPRKWGHVHTQATHPTRRSYDGKLAGRRRLKVRKNCCTAFSTHRSSFFNSTTNPKVTVRPGTNAPVGTQCSTL